MDCTCRPFAQDIDCDVHESRLRALQQPQVLLDDANVRAIGAVVWERLRQEQKCVDKREEGLVWLTCADRRMGDGDKLAVLMEEVGEVARELCEARAAKQPPSGNLRDELVQVAAVAVAWIEALDTAAASEPEDGEELSCYCGRRDCPRCGLA